jgi:predicted TIM-barrel fold metal-dependent hydrolase
MIVDFHTHVFPPAVRDNREEFIRRDPTFAELYSNPKARIATAEDLLASMDEAGVDTSVAAGFAWQDADTIRRHNDYLLDCAAASNSRIMPFTTVNMKNENVDSEIGRCAAAGARGLGELRPDNQGWELDGDDGGRLAAAAAKHGLVLLAHVSEPVGRAYPGKEGGSIGAFYGFCRAHPEITVVGAHLAGGLPFYSPMSDVRELFTHLYVDTAAERLLYDSAAFDMLHRFIGARRVLFGSDFPLVSQKREIAELTAAIPDEADLRMVLGENAQRLLGL